MENKEYLIDTEPDPGPVKHQVVDTENAIEKCPESSECITEFDKITWATDFTLVVEGKSLHVSKTVLGLTSPVFERLFNSEFKERCSHVLELPGKSLTDVLEFLRCIYPNTATTINSENVLKILPLVDEYQVSHLEAVCEKTLLTSIDDSTTADRIYEILEYASVYDLPEVKRKCIDHASKKSKEELSKAKTIFEPPDEVLIEILENIHANMEEKVVALESQIQTIKTDLKIAHLENEVLKRHWTLSAKTSMKEQLNPTLNWREETVILHYDKRSNSREAFTKSVLIWDAEITVEAQFVQRQDYKGGYCHREIWLNGCVRSSEMYNMKCEIKIKYEVLNRYSHEGSLNFFHEGSGYFNGISKDLVKDEEISKGEFYQDDKLYVVVSIFMSKPYICK